LEAAQSEQKGRRPLERVVEFAVNAEIHGYGTRMKESLLEQHTQDIPPGAITDPATGSLEDFRRAPQGRGVASESGQGAGSEA
jgi:hypothetical protein